MGPTMDRIAKLDYGNPRWQLPSESLGNGASTQRARSYEEGLSVRVRRNHGAVYTPDHLVCLILDLAHFRSSEPIERLRVLDPACGCGVFLAHAARRLAERLAQLGFVLGTKHGASHYSALVEANLFGVDKDPAACELARDIVTDQVRSLVGNAKLPGNFFQTNICNADYLREPQWPSNGSTEQSSFDLIVGNPPYVTTSRLTDEEKDSFRKRFKTAYGRIDLYSLFFERSTELLAHNGTLAFITPDKFLTSESGSRLRSLLWERTSIQTIARFDSHRVFKKAATVPCITVVSRSSQATGSIQVLRLAENGSSPQIRIDDRWEAEIPPRPGSPWRLLSPETFRILERMRESGAPLGELSERISAGIATGRDNIYVVAETIARQLEQALLNPAVRGKNIRPFGISGITEYLIVPYQDTSSGPSLVNLDNYPHIRTYLEAHQKELRSRHCVRQWGKTWFDLHDPWTFNLTNTPKILFPDIANGNRFVFDPGNRCPLHSVYYLIPKLADGEYLAAILNSEPIEFFIRARAPIAKDGFSRYRKQFLRDVPIPQMTTEDRQAVIDAARRGSMEEVNRLVTQWFGLNGAQQSAISGFVDRARHGGR